jgi:hypothetical protein
MKFFSRRYRIMRWWSRYLRITDIFRLGVLAAAGALAANSYSFSPKVSMIAGASYFVLMLAAAVQTFHEREAYDSVQGEVVWGLFHQMNKEIFHGDHRARFTLFRCAPIRRDFIVPWYRYCKGALGPIQEAEKSKARYKRNEGLTGAAWVRTGQLLWPTLPKFSDRAEFEKYYIYELKIDRDIVQELSDFMVGVETIFTCGFEDGHGKFLGVLSLDLQSPVPVNFDSQALALVVRSIGSVLESFGSTERRNHG